MRKTVTGRFGLNGDRGTKYHRLVIQRLHIHNFRCLDNFELKIAGSSSVLLIGKNGTGKTTVRRALEILQKIARGENRVGDIVSIKDFSWGRSDAPMRFEIEADLKGAIYKYYIAFELPPTLKELRILEEGFEINGNPIFARSLANVQFARTNQDKETPFPIDWHLAALSIVQEQSTLDPLYIFKRWLARTIILQPIPSLITGESERETLFPNITATDFGAWFSGLIASAPAAYGTIERYLREVMPDFKDLQNPLIGKDSRSLEVQFLINQKTVKIPFEELSDGEKCFMICALVIAANEAYGPLTCFWDEPDSHLALSEVGHFMMTLRKVFQSGGQFITTSHSPEAIRRFSEENTLLLFRENHLEPTKIRSVGEIKVRGGLVSALIRGDVEP